MEYAAAYTAYTWIQRKIIQCVNGLKGKGMQLYKIVFLHMHIQ